MRERILPTASAHHTSMIVPHPPVESDHVATDSEEHDDIVHLTDQGIVDRPPTLVHGSLQTKNHPTSFRWLLSIAIQSALLQYRFQRALLVSAMLPGYHLHRALLLHDHAPRQSALDQHKNRV